MEVILRQAVDNLGHPGDIVDVSSGYARNFLLPRGIAYEEALAERIATIPAGRIGDPEEFGAACAYLCSAQAGFVTGQNLLLDGGAYPGTF